LVRLHADTTRYVTRSVANHLNDISKSDPALVLDTLARWRDQKLQSPAELEWMTRHALRGLIKAGHLPTLAFLGYRTDAKVTVSELSLSKNRLKMGEGFEVSFSLSTPCDLPIILDYVIDFVKANGQKKPKVFKLKQTILKANAAQTFAKTHTFKYGATTFALYEGQHRLNIQVNGQIVDGIDFWLTSP